MNNNELRIVRLTATQARDLGNAIRDGFIPATVGRLENQTLVPYAGAADAIRAYSDTLPTFAARFSFITIIDKIGA